jgi:hypothetical protein
LVAIVSDSYLLDLSLDQASRPQKGIHIYPGGLAIPEDFCSGEAAWREQQGCLIVYKALPKNKNFVASANWLQPHQTRRAIRATIQRIQKQLDKA